MASATNFILTWLAAADMLTIIVSCLPAIVHFYIIKDSRLPFPSSQSFAWIRYQIFNVSFTVACHTIAIWLTITLAIFRYLFMNFPTRSAALCTVTRAKYAVFSVYVATVFLCVPNYLAIESFQGEKNQSMIIIETAEENSTTFELLTYYSIRDRTGSFHLS